MKTICIAILLIILSAQSFAQTSADSVVVTFRAYEASTSSMFVPGEFNTWGHNSSGVISASDSSHMTVYNSTWGCWMQSFSLKIKSPTDNRRHVADTVVQYKINKGGVATGWYSDPLNPEVNTSENGNSVLRLTKLFWFQYNQVVSGSNITEMTMGLMRAESDNITSVSLTYGVSSNSTLTTVDVTAGYNASNSIWDWTPGTSIPKLDYIKLVAYNNHGDSTVYTRGGYVWYYIQMPSYVKNGVTLPSVASNDSTSFRLQVSNKDYVLLRIAPAGQPVATATPIVMNHNNDSENWWVNVKLAAGTYEYLFEIENGKQIYDPFGKYIGTNGTRFTVGAEGLTGDNYSWHSTSYTRPPINKLLVYEMNLEEFAGGYYGLSSTQVRWFHLRNLIPYLDSLGINAIELMPVTDWGLIGSSGFSWGYDVNSYFALEPTFGTPADFKQFIDSAHTHGIAVIMDMVFNHLNETSALWQMQPDESVSPYFKLCSDLRYNEDNMCLFRDLDHWTNQTQDMVYQALKMWVDQYHIDGFRYDYTQGIGWNMADTSYGVLGWTKKIARDYNNSVYQIAEHLPESPALVYYSGLTSAWHGNFREKLFNETDNQNTSLSDFESYVLGLGSYGTNDSPNSPAWYANRTQPVNDCSNHDEQSLFYEMIHYKGVDTTTALKRDRLYSTFMFTSLGIPMLWEGIEFGAPRGYTTNKLDYRPVEWNYYKTTNGKTQFSYYHTLVNQRKYNPALYQGNLVTQWRYDADRVLVWGFNDPVTGAQVEVIANLSGSTKTESNVPWLSGGVWYDVFDQSAFNASGTSLPSFTVAGYTARVFSNRSNTDLGIPTGSGGTPTIINGLVATYPFNGNANDGSGNVNNGIVNGATSVPNRFGTASSAFHFNGTSDYIQVPNSASLSFSSKFAVNLWVNIDSGGSGHPRFWSKGSTPDGMEFFADSTGAQQKRIAFKGNIGGTGGLFGGYSKSQIANQSWAMVTYVQDSLTSKLYINHVLDTTFQNTSGTLPQTSSDLFFGKNSQSGSDYFNGALDDINIYNRTISQGEIDSMYFYGGYIYNSIAGKKYKDRTGDSSVAGDAGLSGWVIKLYNNCNLVARKVTDANGNYKFDSLLAGTYTVEESLKSGWVQTYPRLSSPNVITSSCGQNAGQRSYSMTVGYYQTITGIDFANSQLGSICGTIYSDLNDNGKKETGEPGLYGWTVQLTGPVTASMQTDSTGRYCFTGIPAGTYSVAEVQQAGWAKTTANWNNILLTSGSTIDTLNYGNYMNGNLSGVVFNDMNGDGIMDGPDTLLSGWHIYLNKVGQPSPYDSAVTSSDGNFLFAALEYGKYVVYQEHRSGWTQTTPVYDTITATSGINLSNMNFGNVNADLASFYVNEKWNMVSVPIKVLNYSKAVLFPPALSSAFKYVGSYVADDPMQNRVGYWLKFPSAQYVPLLGTKIMTDTFTVNTGWNMIGSISLPVLVSSIISNPAGIVTSQFFKYNRSYVPSDTIVPGSAYWVKANQSGVLILSAGASLSAANRIHIQPLQELPPPPPDAQNAGEEIPKDYSLNQNYPNPFNPTTVIRYGLPASNVVTLTVYNMLGQRVAVLVNETQDAGWHEVTFDASALPSGMYIYKIQAGPSSGDATRHGAESAHSGQGFTDVKKLILLK